MNGKHRLWVAVALGVAVLAGLGIWMRGRSPPISMPLQAPANVADRNFKRPSGPTLATTTHLAWAIRAPVGFLLRAPGR